MYRQTKMQRTGIKGITCYAGEQIEQRMRRIKETNEPISDSAPVMHNAKKDGVVPEGDIRTDKWAIAAENKNAVSNARFNMEKEREKTMGEKAKEGMEKEQGNKKE